MCMDCEAEMDFEIQQHVNECVDDGCLLCEAVRREISAGTSVITLP